MIIKEIKSLHTKTINRCHEFMTNQVVEFKEKNIKEAILITLDKDGKINYSASYFASNLDMLGLIEIVKTLMIESIIDSGGDE